MMDSKKSNLLLIIAPLAFAAVVSFWSLGNGALNNHECLVSVTAREMLETNDWILPRFNGEERLQKTPLCYWLVASVAKITGKVDEFSSRLPSAFLALLSAAAILYFVSQWLGLPIATLSTAVWASTIAFVRYAHCARPEMALCSFITISMLSFYSAMRTQSSRQRIWYMLVFWLSFSLAMLAKGPAPLALVVPPIFIYFAVFRQWKRIKDVMPIIGPILFLLIFMPWPIMVALRAPEGLMFWKREFVDRFAGDYASGHKPPWYYLSVVFLFTAPFSAFVPYTILAPFYSIWERKRPAMWYLWIWFVVQVVIMSISGGKRQHYILSAFPAFSILAGICLYDMIFELKAFNLKQVKTLFTCHIIAALVGAAGLLYWAFTKHQSFAWPAVHTVMMLLITLAIVVFLFLQNQKVFATVLLFAGYCAILMAVFVYFIDPLDYNNPSRDFSIKAGRLANDGKEIIAYNYVSARTIHYVGRTVPEIYDINDVRKKYDLGTWVIATGDEYKQMINAGGFDIAFYQKIAERHGQQNVEGALFHKSNN
jgi:4-amino-4-deoxy-L-arabinose transferase-like glycosyltransferase